MAATPPGNSPAARGHIGTDTPSLEPELAAPAVKVPPDGGGVAAPTRPPSAARFLERLEALRSDEEQAKYRRYFKTGPGEYAEGDFFTGVRMGVVFELAKEFAGMELPDVEALLEQDIHEARAGAVKIMALQASSKKTPECRRRELFELYLRRHDRINNWDLVDLGAPRVVGGWLRDKPRDVLYDLARSPDLWERRTAIVATSWFLRDGEQDDTYAIAELLLGDSEDLIHKAVGGWLRDAGRSDRQRLLQFLDTHAPTMPRVALRYAIEHLDQAQRQDYLARRSAERGHIGTDTPAFEPEASAAAGKGPPDR
ncbi:DNA alkylation repair protein [Pseudarthrobacter sp. PvP090]|uniref:DNA alkylation repair protein n=1 Tax=Pseudarthrobacter sp. PvP090 TaxID=3156393 RepID=UPI00339AB46F